MAVRCSGTSGAGAQRGAGWWARHAAVRRSGRAAARRADQITSAAAGVALRGCNAAERRGQSEVQDY